VSMAAAAERAEKVAMQKTAEQNKAVGDALNKNIRNQI